MTTPPFSRLSAIPATAPPAHVRVYLCPSYPSVLYATPCLVYLWASTGASPLPLIAFELAVASVPRSCL